MMIRTTASIVMTLACALALPAGAQPASSGARPKGAARLYSLEIDGKSGVLLGAQIEAPTAVPGAPRDFTLPASPLSDITLTAGTGLPQPFYDWVGAAFEAKQVPFEATLHAADTTGRSGETIALADPLLVSVAFSALDPGSHAAMHMDVKLRAAVKPEPAKSPKLPKAGAPASTRWRASGYRLTLGQLDTAHVTHIAAISLSPGTPAQLEVTTTGTTAEAFVRLAPTLKHRAPQPIDDGTLEFLGSDGSVLVTLVLQGVQVTDLYYAPSRSGGPKPAVVGIVARLARLEFAPAMAH